MSAFTTKMFSRATDSPIPEYSTGPAAEVPSPTTHFTGDSAEVSTRVWLPSSPAASNEAWSITRDLGAS